MTARRKALSPKIGSAEYLEASCPGIATHPRQPLPERARLSWGREPRGEFRIIDHTCCCQAVYFELISVGGVYQVRKTIQSNPPQHLYAGAWTRPEAVTWWLRILMGSAR